VVDVVHRMRADMFSERFVKPAFQTSLAIAVSAIERGVRIID